MNNKIICEECGHLMIKGLVSCRHCTSMLSPQHTTGPNPKFTSISIKTTTILCHFFCLFDDHPIHCHECDYYAGVYCELFNVSSRSCQKCSASLSLQYSILKDKLSTFGDDSEELCCDCHYNTSY